MCHLNFLFFQACASCSFCTCSWSSVPAVHQLKTNHLQIFPCRNLKSSLTRKAGLSLTVSSGLTWISDEFNCGSCQLSSSKGILTKIKTTHHQLGGKRKCLSDGGFSDSNKAAEARLVVSNLWGRFWERKFGVADVRRKSQHPSIIHTSLMLSRATDVS